MGIRDNNGVVDDGNSGGGRGAVENGNICGGFIGKVNGSVGSV